MSGEKLFGVIVCDSQAKWGGPEGIAKRVENLLSTENSVWKTFKAEEGEFPTEDELNTFHAIYITGSKHSVHDKTQQWIKGLEHFIQRAYDLKKPKVFGTCFGHQIIAQALGGKVALNPSRRFICHNEEIQLCGDDSDDSVFLRNLRKINDGKPFRILQSHSDCVEELPENAKNVATSDSCEHEIVLFSVNIIGSQSHADFTVEDLTEIILPSKMNANAITKEELEYANQSFQQPNNCLDLAKAIREFFNS
ncbi:gamma-glutamyl peptidase 4-like [Dendronephthya gigantea]|uniref:gamma-glutamyl peptidase 4-like n=1 Tax=Dendronephthya gigantea TaxID=151771 RepID=UPI00106963C9|nr:gamma-glutamyl peptidase 4-like [Dendronephthya gigantea]